METYNDLLLGRGEKERKREKKNKKKDRKKGHSFLCQLLRAGPWGNNTCQAAPPAVCSHRTPAAAAPASALPSLLCPGSQVNTSTSQCFQKWGSRAPGAATLSSVSTHRAKALKLCFQSKPETSARDNNWIKTSREPMAGKQHGNINTEH